MGRCISLLLLFAVVVGSASVLGAPVPTLPLPEPPPLEGPLCMNNPPFSGVYGWADDRLTEYMSVVAELTPWHPPPRRIAVVEGCVGFSDTDANAEIVGGSRVALTWPGVRRCYDGWQALYGALGDRTLAMTFEGGGGCRSAVEAGPIALDRLKGLAFEPSLLQSPAIEVRQATVEYLLREQTAPGSCRLLSEILLGAGSRGAKEEGAHVLRIMASAEASCLVAPIQQLASVRAYSVGAALALARMLEPDARGVYLLRIVEKGGDGAATAARRLGSYAVSTPELVGALTPLTRSPDAGVAAAAQAALLALEVR